MAGLARRMVLVSMGKPLWWLMGMVSQHCTASGAVYFLRTTTFPEHCQKNDPLSLRDVEVFRLSGAGSTFDLTSWTGANGTAYSLSAVEGVLISTQANGEIY